MAEKCAKRKRVRMAERGIEWQKRQITLSGMHASLSASARADRAVPGKKNENGKSRPVNYGRLTALALDPIEKKPLAMFAPGSKDFIGRQLRL